MFSLYSNRSLERDAPLPSNYISFEEWSDIRKMRLVLFEISKFNPKTRKIYDKFNNREVGFINNKLNKHDIIYNYIKIKKLTKNNIDKLRYIIDNYKKNAEIIDSNYLSIYNQDKKTIIHILKNYLNTNINYKILLDIIRLLENNEIYPDSFEINKLLVELDNYRLTTDIKYYRSFSYLI